jgi:hypothetical protein
VTSCSCRTSSENSRALNPSGRLLDRVDRASEILFGEIMVLTFTGWISVAEGQAADTRTILTAAIGCNLAWGIVDATMYLMANITERVRGLATLRAWHGSEREAAHRLIHEVLPPVVSSGLTSAEVETMHEHLAELPESTALSLSRTDFAGATGVFLLVSLSTFPIVIPFVLVHDVIALRTSNAVAIGMLFAAG